MKRAISYFVVVLLILSVLVTTSAAGERKKVTLGDSLLDADVICSFRFGKKENEVGFKESDASNEGPESFVVTSDKVYLLDSIKKRIIISDDNEIRFVDLSCCRYPYHMSVSGEFIYVLDYNGDEIMVFNECGESTNPIPFPEKIGFDSIKKILCLNGELQIQSYENDYYAYDGAWQKVISAELKGDFEKEKSLTVDRNMIILSTGENTSAELLRYADDSIFLGVNEFVPYIPVIESEYTVRKYNADGVFEGSTVIDMIPAVSIPRDCVYINDLGEVYVMQCREDGVFITKPHLRAECYSHMDELSEIGNEIYCSLLKEPETRTSTITSKTRTTIANRASAAESLYWVIKSTDYYPPSVVTVPHCVSDHSAGDTIKGIPYCFGAYLSSASQFTTLHNSGYTAGNINKNNHYVSNTAGLDCSGFVSYAYSIGSAKTTEYFYNNGVAVSVGGNGTGNQYAHNSVALANMESMDYLLKYNSSTPSTNHVMLYVSFSNNYLTIYDSTTISNIDKVSLRHPSSSDMSGYVLKSPYACGGTAPCSYGSYHHDDLHHWKKCVYNCGSTSSYSTHTWVNDAGGGYRCNVCGHHVDIMPYGNRPVLVK